MSDQSKPPSAAQLRAAIASDEIEYRGYRLEVRPLSQSGWKVFIYPPNGVVALEKFPRSEALGGRDAVIEEAKRVVDQYRTGRR
jgi:hypothetical protein